MNSNQKVNEPLAAMIKPSSPPVPRVVVLGDCGVGKTTYAARFPNPIVLDVDSGARSINVPIIPISNVADLHTALSALQTEKHEYHTVVIDSINQLEDKLISKIFTENCIKTQDISERECEYAMLLTNQWLTIISQLDALRDQGIICVMVSHGAREEIYNGEGAYSYHRMGMRLTPTDRVTIAAWADVIVYIAMHPSESTSYPYQRRCTVIPTAGYVAKCRYTNVSEEDVDDPCKLLKDIGWVPPVTRS